MILHVPLGNYMAGVHPGLRSSVEKFVYRLVRVQPDAQQRWTKYLSSLLAFSLVSPLVRYALLLLQVNAPEPSGHKGMTAALAFNTAISFTTNTSWQKLPRRIHPRPYRAGRRARCPGLRQRRRYVCQSR